MELDGRAAKSGNELLAISHNANVSDGWMYPVDVDNTTGRPIDAAWAAARDRNERLVEIKQERDSRRRIPCCRPTTSSPATKQHQAILGLPASVGRIDHITGSFGRQALKDGITMQDVRGYNAYKFGMAGSSDSHNTGSPYRQDNFFGLHADADGTVERRFAGVLIGGTMDVRLENPGGLTGVWAEENTRASIWDAMYRKETFGVSGPHIKVRFFGGWGYDKDIASASDWVKQSYAGGVPMGADLPADAIRREGNGSALCRVGSERSDLCESRPHPGHQGLDAEWPELREDLRRGLGRRPSSPTSGQGRVRPSAARWTWRRRPTRTTSARPSSGAVVGGPRNRPAAAPSTMCACWRFPPRWTLIQSVKSGLPPPDVVPLTGQERARGNTPIWYAPSARARKSAPAGMTVAT
ncbi:MAG: DUF3604 domain-containing protein [Burkholderiales bacterium]